MKNYTKLLAALVAFSLVFGFGSFASAENLEFKVTLSEEIADEPLSGRLKIIITDENEEEPRHQVGFLPNTVPLWGIDVNDWAPGETITLSDGDLGLTGYPLEKFVEIPPEDYYVQAFLTVYETFQRADGHELQLPKPGGAGGVQRNFGDPGNLYSDVIEVEIELDPAKTVDIFVDNMIEPDYADEIYQQGRFEDTEHVRYLTIESEYVSEFWGQPMEIGANVLLPKGYEENPEAEYPVYFRMGHWPGGRPPLRFEEETDIYEAWFEDDFPRFIVVEFRDANPFYGTSYSVNSRNVGPYGDALLEEMIPHLEEEFRMIGEPWARVLGGGSTGGWESLALQVFHPDFFGGTWPQVPDSPDFRAYQLVNVYEHDNAYINDYGWVQTERPSMRTVDGEILFSIMQENHWENVLGSHGRSGRQWDIWEAVHGPVGKDGYPATIWDPVSGQIDPDVAEEWREFDLRYIMEENWDEIGQDLVGKIHIHMAHMDNFYLNLGTYHLEDFLEETEDPYYDGSITYYERTGHTTLVDNVDLIPIMNEHIIENAPEDVDTDMWNY